MKPTLILIAALSLVPAHSAGQSQVLPPAASDARSEPRTLRLIDLHDMLLADAAFPDFVEPEPGLNATPAPTDDASRIAERAEQWQAMLRLWIEPTLVKELDRLELLTNGTLVAQLPAASHAWLDRCLELQRADRAMFTSQFRIFVGPKGAFDSLLPGGNSNLLPPADVERLLEICDSINKELPGTRISGRLSTPSGVDLLIAPTLTMFTRSRAFISTYDEVEYVKDWSVRVVEPGRKSIAVPSIDSVRDGLGISMRGIELAPDRLGLEIELCRWVLTKPIRTTSVRLDLDGGRDFEIALPEVEMQKLRSQLVIEPGRSAYFRGPAPSPDKETLVLLTVFRGESPPRRAR